MNLDRYDDRQKAVIKKYFQVLADTRLTGKISEGIKIREVKYWERFSVPVVIQALSIHIQKYTSNNERYTRGIMRNLEQQGYTEIVTQGKKTLITDLTKEQRDKALREEIQMLSAKKQRRKEMSEHE